VVAEVEGGSNKQGARVGAKVGDGSNELGGSKGWEAGARSWGGSKGWG
jgi:hypothetical protein